MWFEALDATAGAHSSGHLHIFFPIPTGGAGYIGIRDTITAHRKTNARADLPCKQKIPHRKVRVSPETVPFAKSAYRRSIRHDSTSFARCIVRSRALPAPSCKRVISLHLSALDLVASSALSLTKTSFSQASAFSTATLLTPKRISLRSLTILPVTGCPHV